MARASGRYARANVHGSISVPVRAGSSRVANRAFLYASEIAGFPCDADRLLRGRNYAIPLLWLASADVEAISLEKDSEEPGDEEEFTYICVEVQRARQLLWRRRVVLEKLADNLGDLLSTWTAFLDDLPERYLKLEVSEVLDMHETGDPLLRSALQAFDEPSDDHWSALFALVDLSAHYDVDARVLRTPRATTAGQLMARFGQEPSPGQAETVLPPEPLETALFGYPIDNEPERRDAESPSTLPASHRSWPMALVFTVAAAILSGVYLVYLADGSPRLLALGATFLAVGLAMFTRSAVSLPAYVVGGVVIGLDAVLLGAMPWGGVVLLTGIPGVRMMLRESRGEE